MCHFFGSIFLGDVFQHLIAPVIIEVDIYIRGEIFGRDSGNARKEDHT